VLEVFGEHTLSRLEILGLLALALALLAGYQINSASVAHPLLKLGLLTVRTLRIGVTGNFVTRLGIGGLPFLLPMFYQIGLGYTPIQSGLLIMPQSISAILLKFAVPGILVRFGFRKILLSNTVLIGIFIALFSAIHPGTPVLWIVAQASIYGFFSSLQFTCMNTLVFADVKDADVSQASTIVSTVQQLSMSFGVACASLVAAYFIPDRSHSSSVELLKGIHHAFIFLGIFTAFSALGFIELKPTDGEMVSRHHELH
jgi:MFS family permease